MDRPMYVQAGPPSLRDKDGYKVISKLAASFRSLLGSNLALNSTPDLDLNFSLNLFLKHVRKLPWGHGRVETGNR